MKLRHSIVFFRKISVTSNPNPKPKNKLLEKWTRSFWPKFEGWMTSYEDFIGIKQVKEAHSRVLQAETDFVTAQEERRQAQILMNSMQVRLREVRSDLDRTPRGDNNYLELIKREIELIRDERNLRDTFEREERRERELFNNLSNALRFSREKERAQSEKTKYWSVMASLIGAFLGIIGTTINSQLKLRKLRELMTENTEASAESVISKLEFLTTSKSDQSEASILAEIRNFLKTIELRENQEKQQETSPTTPTYEEIGLQLEEAEERRQRDLLIATLSVIVIVPLLIIKFSGS